jgi:hypothetical protein
VPLLSVVFWLSLYLFEESWAKMLGDNLAMFLYLGGVVFVLERIMRSALPNGSPAPASAALYPATIGPAGSPRPARRR